MKLSEFQMRQEGILEALKATTHLTVSALNNHQSTYSYDDAFKKLMDQFVDLNKETINPDAEYDELVKGPSVVNINNSPQSSPEDFA